MSWAEDEGLDCYSAEDFMNKDEREWEKGIHIDQNGIEHKISHMTDSHLKNTIKYFQNIGYDTYILENELINRNNKITMENKFIDGLFLSARKENQPEWIKGQISINIEKFIPYLKANAKEGKWVNLDLLETRDGRLYLKLNEYKPKSFATETEKIASQNSEYFDISDIPL